MKRPTVWIPVTLLMLLTALALPDLATAKDVVRPEEIKSMRQVIYDDETYEKLAGLWKDYYDEYPSEYAYANWMYAARYAGDKDYSELLDKGVNEYPANPTLQYLKSLVHLGAHNDTEGRALLERAIALDPGFVDPWFVLVTHYMDSREDEKLDLALRRLLESGIITDEVMDFNYNMLISLEENAILITNGDNDTYPGWILTRILEERPDVAIVNLSLLNSEWYPLYVIEQGLPRFISKGELDELRDSVIRGMKEKNACGPAAGPFGDTLIEMIVESAERAGRPVYFSKTLYITDKLRQLAENGRDLGLVTLVTSSKTPYNEQVLEVYSKWIEDFRTGGLDSWRLHNAPDADAGLRLVSNYMAGIMKNLTALKEYAPDQRIKLFHWFIDHTEKLLSEEVRYRAAYSWCCYASDIKEIDEWCKDQGMECKEPAER
ncbi:MAG: hypothetical protein KAT85_01035 [candidate division Zixibacteria bacterium]|nr:hypothetical protein [candidate division Zixibacteria bacterium]